MDNKVMSRAFVKESDGEEQVLPDLPVSPHRNLVTAEGLKQIENTLERLDAERAKAIKSKDKGSLVRVERDLRYWTQRRASAEPVPPPRDAQEVRFGLCVTLEREDGQRETWRIVGQDEADPAKGLLSYVSPLARALTGKRAGDTVRAGQNDAEIIAIRVPKAAAK